MNQTRQSASALAGLLAVAAALIGLSMPVHAAGLLGVKQTISGMDCAPCAYGVEQGILKLPGVTRAKVNLNEGIAIVALNPDSPTTLERIRRVIRDHGFTPKDAEVTLSGRLVRTSGINWLQTPGLPRYQLAAANPAAQAALQDHPTGAPIEVRATVPQSGDTTLRIDVTQVMQ